MVSLDIRQITEAYFARIHRTALVLTGNPWDADDLAQETFLVFGAKWAKLSRHKQRLHLAVRNFA